METFEHYQQVMRSRFKELKKVKEIILFGTTSMGQMAHQVLAEEQVRVLGFCDNNEEKQGSIYRGLFIYNPEKIMQKHPNAVVIICSFLEEHIKEIRKQLHVYGIIEKNIWDKDIILWLFHTKMTDRKADSKRYMKMLYDRKYHVGLELDNISIVVTDYCNLNCKNCMRMTKHMKDLKHLLYKDIIKSMHEVSNLAGTVRAYNILGGEPFLYPDLEQIVKGIPGCDNVEMVDIVTNGKIFPSKHMLNCLKSYGVRIIISDYGFYAQDVKKLIETLESMEMIYDVYDEKQKWHPISYKENMHKTEEELVSAFQKCKKCRECFEIYGRELFPCGFFSTMFHLNMLGKECEKDFVNLEMDDEWCKEKLEEWCNNTSYINTCNYCGFNWNVFVERGEQE